MSKVFGIAYISVTGYGVLASMPGATLDLGGVERTPIMNNGRLVGFSEEDKPAILVCQIAMRADDYVAEVARMTDATLTFECDTGNTFMVSKAFCSKPPILRGAGSGGDGNYTLEVIGNPAVEMAHVPFNPTGLAAAY